MRGEALGHGLKELVDQGVPKGALVEVVGIGRR